MAEIIICIISHKEELNPYEQISLKQCCSVLAPYDIELIFPKGLSTKKYKEFPFRIEKINSRWLKSYRNFNRLKVVPELYKRYSKDYEYILFYEPDAFIFKDDLQYWAKESYDYIGAPWLKGMGQAKNNAEYVGVGNGGFSLRKIESHLKVLHNTKRLKSRTDFWYGFDKMNWKGQLYHGPKLTFDYLFRNRFHYLFNSYFENEDVFWGKYAANSFDWFNTPSIEKALQFSMEVHPSRMFKDNNESLPTGCHGWWKYDLQFWKDKIASFGYEL